MSLQDIDYRYTYDSDECDILDEFYNEVLKEAKSYKRIAGFFSATSFGVAARGVKGLIENGGTMQMIVSPRLSSEDAEMIKSAYQSPEMIIEKYMLSEVDNISDILDKNYVEAMGWMIANGYLDIKIAVVYDSDGKALTGDEIEQKGLFHIKTGVIEDAEGNIISYSGSINETASGWARNAEEFEVHRMWVPGQEGFCEDQIKRFESYWSGIRGNTKVYSIPEATKKKLIDIAPKDMEDIVYLKRYKCREREREKKKEIESDIDLYFYQNKAFNMWINNDYKLLCEMATGTGKTRTALACMNYALKINDNMAVVICCPQNTLSIQWLNEIKELKIYDGPMVIADSSNGSNWYKQMEECLLDISLKIKKHAIIFTCSKTFSSYRFRKLIEDYQGKVKYMLIGDEAHGLGATATSKGLLSAYEYRVGLSATPSRWFDENGTEKLQSYFGNKIFEFTIKQALHTEKPGTGKCYLTDYRYIPIFSTLTDDEVFNYEEVSQSITRARYRKDNDEEAQKRYERLLMIRADIHKNAENKYDQLESLLDELATDIEDTIIFVTPEQIDRVVDILSRREISCAKYTKDRGTRPLKRYGGLSERDYVLKEFKAKTYQVLVAIKCLDEGIDIPSAKRAIIFASSTNPREFIQRVGRVIRIAKGKELAEIYDFIIVPDRQRMKSDLLKFELSVFEKEQNRIFEISENAINSTEVLHEIDTVNRRVHGWK